MNKEIAKKNAELLLWMAENPGENKCIDNTCVYFVDEIDGLKFYGFCGESRKSEWITEFLKGNRVLSRIKLEPKPITWQEAIERMLDGKPVSRKGCGPIMKNPFLEGEYFGIPIKVREIEWLIPPE